MDRIFIATFLIVFALSNLAQEERIREQPRSLHAGYENGVSIPFELQSGFLIVVSGQLDARSGLHFILDTGATRSIVDERLIMADPVTVSKAVEVFSFDKRLEINRVKVERLEIGPIHATNPEIEVTNLSRYSELAKNADGILGMDLLTASDKILIDYRARTVSFSVTDARAKPLYHPQCLIVTVSIQGVPVRLAVDTGFEGIAIHEDRLRHRIPNLRTEGEPLPVQMGHFKTTKIRVPDVKIGGPSEATEILLMRGPRENEIDRFDGYLGVASLRADLIELDFAAGTLRWQ